MPSVGPQGNSGKISEFFSTPPLSRTEDKRRGDIFSMNYAGKLKKPQIRALETALNWKHISLPQGSTYHIGR